MKSIVSIVMLAIGAIILIAGGLAIAALLNAVQIREMIDPFLRTVGVILVVSLIGSALVGLIHINK